MTPAAMWKVLRTGLDPMLKERGFSRLKASPPAWTRAGGPGLGRHGRADLGKPIGAQTRVDGASSRTLWFKARSVGGAFIGAIQTAPAPRPGIEWMAGPFESARIPQRFTPSQREEAEALHARICARHRHTIQQVPSDFWFHAEDEEDVAAWAALLARVLPGIV